MDDPIFQTLPEASLAATNHEIKNALLGAASEIENLRRANEYLGAQVRVIEVFRTALGTRGDLGCPCAIDSVYSLRRLADKIMQPNAQTTERTEP